MARATQLIYAPHGGFGPEAWPTLPELRETFDRPSEILDQARHEIAIGGTVPLGVGADEPFKHDAIHRLCYSGGNLLESAQRDRVERQVAPPVIDLPECAPRDRLEILRVFMNGED